MMDVEEIKITRAEGPTPLCGITRTFTSYKDATAWLYAQSGTFPKTGGYDKHDFVIVFVDGETYSGRLDCKHHSKENNDLNVYNHVREFAEFCGGRAKNPWMGQEKYARFLEDIGDDAVKSYQNFLDTYLL